MQRAKPSPGQVPQPPTRGASGQSVEHSREIVVLGRRAPPGGRPCGAVWFGIPLAALPLPSQEPVPPGKIEAEIAVGFPNDD